MAKNQKVENDSAEYDHIKLSDAQVKELVVNIIGLDMEDSVAADLLLLLYATANAASTGDVESLLVAVEEAAMTNSRAPWKALHVNVNTTFQALQQSEGRAQ